MDFEMDEMKVDYLEVQWVVYLVTPLVVKLVDEMERLRVDWLACDLADLLVEK